MTDRTILRDLAKQYTAIAQSEAQKPIPELYRALNRLKPIRPVVLMDEIPWGQFSDCDELRLQCEGEFERQCEDFFRKELYRHCHFPVDRLFENRFPLHRSISIGSFGIDVSESILAFDDGGISSHAYRDQLPSEDAIAKLHTPEITEDEADNARRLDRAQALFGDILPIKMIGLEYVGFYEPWDNIATWRGVEPLLWDLVDEPEFMHHLMERLLEIRLEMLAIAEQRNLLEPAGALIHCTAGLADELPGEMPDGRVTRRNLWGRGAAQIFSTVSPAMHEEFEIAYAQRFFQGFGLTYYGCCEPLDRKIDIIRALPNLRKISITPWADVDRAADQIGSDYVLSGKANPAFLASSSLDESTVRKEIDCILTACRRNHTPVELVLKDVSSVGHNPKNLDQWAKIAMEAVQD